MSKPVLPTIRDCRIIVTSMINTVESEIRQHETSNHFEARALGFSQGTINKADQATILRFEMSCWQKILSHLREE